MKKIPPGRAIIYALADPRFPRRFLHVGSTKESLRARLGNHIRFCINPKYTDYHMPRGRGIRAMVDAGYEPAAIPLEECSVEDHLRLEGEWRARARAEGHPLWGDPPVMGPVSHSKPVTLGDQALFDLGGNGEV